MLTIAFALLLQSAAPTAAVQPEAGYDPNKMICRKFGNTGSRLGNKRTCMAAWQWRERENQDRKDLIDLQNSQKCTRGTC